jgi:hypothetical protein
MPKRFLFLTLVTCIWLLVTSTAAQDTATCAAGFRLLEKMGVALPEAGATGEVSG